ncbi:glycoside hydrolase family 95 protein [Herbiconiux sp. CPCC 205763]|uniref:Glycoside hydrolase family 95 protein n=1 Tax=Herbiconiux aconitum TaxID=2970913 RepID=A0ABT2GN69_9MICO|nr:glycoside hydrolase family 95 protein [Herbiconiux aconitum]MCS5717682.1 glycoside hydrolase family 95 protein [Herbiconiux aconitum]
MSARTGFWSNSAGTDWQHGLVAGTGSLGAVLFGTPERHRISICHEDYFLPVNSSIPAPRLADWLPQLRAVLQAGNAVEAGAILEHVAGLDGYDELVWTDPFLPVGEVSWAPEIVDWTDYRRAGDFRSGRIETMWLTDAGEMRVSIIPDREANTVQLEVASEFDVWGLLQLGNETDDEAVTSVGAVDYARYLNPTEAVTQDRALSLETTVDEAALSPLAQSFPPSSWSPRAARLTVTVPPGVELEERSGGLRIHVRANQPLRLAIVVELFGGASSPRPAAHDSHADLFDRCSLDLGGDLDDLPYDEILALSRSGDRSATKSAVELAFASGRHTIISSSGALPPTLVGLWQGTRRPAWSGDYTQNGNLQNGGVASVIATGTPELMLPYFRVLERYVDDYAENAERLFGAPGWLLPARFDTHGGINHFATLFPHTFWIGAGGWAVRLAWDYYSATGDFGFLRDSAWPLARQVMAFYDAFTASESGERHLNPSYSPENTPSDWANPITLDATMDVAVIRDAARLTMRIAATLGMDEYAEKWVTLVEELPQYRVAEDGTFAEWLWPGISENIAHRHVSQLYPFWYENDPAASAPEFRKAALETIRRKLEWRGEKPSAPPEGRMEMAFGLVQLGIAAARLGDAEAALTCVEWLARDHWRSNAVSTHDADAIFNVDASGGLPAIVVEMLIQSQPNSLRLLPALPEAWASGSVRGVRCRGGIVVDALNWDETSVTVNLSRVPDTELTRTGSELTVVAPDGNEQRLLVNQLPASVTFGR